MPSKKPRGRPVKLMQPVRICLSLGTEDLCRLKHIQLENNLNSLSEAFRWVLRQGKQEHDNI